MTFEEMDSVFLDFKEKCEKRSLKLSRSIETHEYEIGAIMKINEPKIGFLMEDAFSGITIHTTWDLNFSKEDLIKSLTYQMSVLTDEI